MQQLSAHPSTGSASTKGALLVESAVTLVLQLPPEYTRGQGGGEVGGRAGGRAGVGGHTSAVLTAPECCPSTKHSFAGGRAGIRQRSVRHAGAPRRPKRAGELHPLALSTSASHSLMPS